jgi:hypothetical protein
MSIHSLRNVFVDSPNSMAARYRLRRWAMFSSTFPDIEQMTVLDLGGRVESWRRAPVRPLHVHVVNLEPADPDPPNWIQVDCADACALPSSIRARHYDLVFSNAVLEHVGGHAKRLAFAAAVSQASQRHWIQTPYRYFPVEPHWLFPWFQQLPVATRAFISQRWPLLHSPSADRQDALSAVMQVELLGQTEMGYYFPDSAILSERIGPLIKSLIAVRN